MNNSALNNQYQQKLFLKVVHQEDQAAKQAADHQERKDQLEKRIKMAELMAEAKHMEKKRSLESGNLEFSDSDNRGYQHAKALLERTYGNLHKILTSFQKEIKE